MKMNVLIAHGGGPTAVMNSSLAGVIAATKKNNKVGKILAARHGIAGLLKNDIIDLTYLSDEQLELMRITPASAIGSCRYKLKEEDYEELLKILEAHHVGYFLYNGGNDSMDTCNIVSNIAKDLRVIGIPKTIDNDLAITDHCPGFGSAARYYATSLAELAIDVQSLNIHVSVIEIMGRDAGWLTAATALSRKIAPIVAPDFLYVPELPFDETKFLSDIEVAWKKKKGLVVAVSEGLVDASGSPLVTASHESAVDSFGHTTRGNVGQYLSNLISEKTGIRSRSEKPGILGRASSLASSNTDREEAYQVGFRAVNAAVNGESGKMVAIKRLSTVPYVVDYIFIPLEKVANKVKKFPIEYLNKEGNDVSEEFLSYIEPLLGDNLPKFFNL